ncbi:MAG: hypothetical protein ABIR96_11025 [Bdellovibrionota bacterium]
MSRVALLAVLCLLSLAACTAALTTNDVHNGNFHAPENLKVSESCSSDGANPDCKAVISTPPERQTEAGTH